MLAVIDNYDSFTWNLVQILGELGAEPRVFRNDTVTPAELLGLGTTRLVVSPGPCTPAEAGVSVEAVRQLGSTTPTLGVCLGHQAIGEAYGGRTVRATRTVHGKVSPIAHNGDPLFAGIPSPMRVTRYHSLVAAPALRTPAPCDLQRRQRAGPSLRLPWRGDQSRGRLLHLVRRPRRGPGCGGSRSRCDPTGRHGGCHYSRGARRGGPEAGK